ncbi:MAG: glycosyltransferase family 4 protein [Deltaproteobacteria bacterium]|nr:glycosyltransferase family 4 protein [Deltaproteobacteria bacterium]
MYREVFGLRDRGWRVAVASVHPPQRDLGEAALDALADEAIVAYRPGVVGRAIAEWLRHPLRASSTLLDGLRLSLFGSDVSLAGRPKVIWQTLAALGIADEVRRLDVSRIHAHMAHVPTTIAMILARHLGLPFSFTGHAVDLFRDGSLLREKLRRAAFCACISEWHRAFYQSIDRLSVDRLPVIRCGVDIERFAPRGESRRTDGRRQIVAVGRLVPKKGFDLLLDAAPALLERHRDLVIRIAGDGPEREALTARWRSLGAPKNIELLGAATNEDVRRMLRDADLFVLPCRIDDSGDRDGIPVVLMEAMACGTPVVSGDLPAIRELITDGDTGLLVPSDDSAALAAAIERVLTDRALAGRLAARGRERVVEEFALEINLRRLTRAFGEPEELHDTERKPGALASAAPT